MIYKQTFILPNLLVINSITEKIPKFGSIHRDIVLYNVWFPVLLR